MSDEGKQISDGIHVNHWCCIDGCGEWGGFGHSRNKVEKITWWCWEHYPHKPNKAQSEAADIADMIGRK